MKKFFKTLFWLILCVAIAFVAFRYGPNLYYRFFGSGNTAWISERFSEELKEKNELVVFETTITGQETASQNAWLIGKVQEVIIPYSYSINFVIDLSQSEVVESGNAIVVYLPPPQASYSKLTVDEAQMKKHDLLYPLTPERYAEIKNEIETKLFEECSTNQSYLDAAWTTAVKNIEALFKSVVNSAGVETTPKIEVIQREVPVVPVEAVPSNVPVTPTATPDTSLG